MNEQTTRFRIVTRNSKEEAERARRNRLARLHAEALAIEAEDAKSSGNLGFVAKWIVHAALPYRDPGDDKPAWGRRSGDVSLVIQPGFFKRTVTVRDARGKTREVDKLVSVGFPYGTYPRLLLAWIATEVVRTRQRELVLGQSIADFMEQLGKSNATGGQRGTITLLKSQMIRLFSATIAVTSDPEAVVWQSDGFRLLDQSMIETFWSPGDPQQLSLFASTIKLSERFYTNLVTNPVPVDLRVLRALSRSPLAIDIYCWLTYRSATLARPTVVAWEALYQQFGSEARLHKFKETFLRALKDVLVVYRSGKVRAERSGLHVFPAAPSVPRRLSA